jgi:hypothetical protein
MTSRDARSPLDGSRVCRHVFLTFTTVKPPFGIPMTTVPLSSLRIRLRGCLRGILGIRNTSRQSKGVVTLMIKMPVNATASPSTFCHAASTQLSKQLIIAMTFVCEDLFGRVEHAHTSSCSFFPQLISSIRVVKEGGPDPLPCNTWPKYARESLSLPDHTADTTASSEASALGHWH